VFALLLHMLAQHSPRVGPVYAGWPLDTINSPLAAIRWFLGDMTEPLFYKSDLAALGLLAGAVAAWRVGRRGAKWAGTLSYGSGLWPWVLASASLSLMLSNLVFGWVLDDGWQPTFVPFVCVAPAMVLLYGAGWRTCVTGAVLGPPSPRHWRCCSSLPFQNLLACQPWWPAWPPCQWARSSHS
jgi:hypothetical protein